MVYPQVSRYPSLWDVVSERHDDTASTDNIAVTNAACDVTNFAGKFCFRVPGLIWICSGCQHSEAAGLVGTSCGHHDALDSRLTNFQRARAFRSPQGAAWLYDRRETILLQDSCSIVPTCAAWGSAKWRPSFVDVKFLFVGVILFFAKLC